MSETLSIELLLISVFVGISISLVLIVRAFKTGFSFWIIQDIILVLMISILSIGVGWNIGLGGLYKYITYPTYNAIIVNIDKEENDGQSAATYTIRIDDKEIISKASTYTSTKKIVGNQVVVNYYNGDVKERSKDILIRYIFGSIFTIILFLILIGYIYSGLYSHINIIFRPKKLHKAAFNNDAKQIEDFILKGIDINTLDKHGLTPLDIAVENNAYESVQTLLNHRANIHRVSDNEETLLHTACYGSDVDIVKLLIGRGLKINVKDKEGNTPLHYACEDDDNLETVKFLLQMHAEINTQNNNHETALHIAIIYNCPEIVAYLISRDIDITLKNTDKLTAQDIAKEEMAYLFLTAEEKEKNDEKIPKYIKLVDRTSFSSNFFIFAGSLFMPLAWFIYTYDDDFINLFIATLFASIGFLFFIKGLLDRISLILFGNIPVYIVNHSTKVSSTLTGYIVATSQLEKIKILFTLSHKKHTSSTNMDGDKSIDTKVIWEGASMGELRFIDSTRVIYFDIPIKSTQITYDTYSWELSLKQKSNIFILQRNYDINIL